MTPQTITCKQVQADILELNQNDSLLSGAKQHLLVCTECASFYKLHRQLVQSFAEEPIPEAPSLIKQRLLAQLNPPVIKQRKPVFAFFGNVLHIRFRTAAAFAFSLLFIALFWKPYILKNNRSANQNLLLFQRQDSLILYNFYSAQNQNLGISSKDDSLLSKLRQTFPR